MQLRSLDLIGFLEPEHLYRLFPHLELHDLARDVDGEVVHEHDVPRDFVVGDLSLAELFYVLLGHGLTGFHLHPGAELFSVFHVRHPDNVDIRDLLVVVEELLDLARVNVLPATDHHVLEPANDLEVALLVHGAEIARVVPAVLVKRGMGGRGIVVITFHNAVAAGADLADLAERYDLAGLGINDLEFCVRECTPDRGDPAFERILGRGHRDARTCLGLAVHDHDLAHVHLRVDLLHHFNRAGRACHDAGAEGSQIVF